jgi:hypothetical protein
MKALTALLSTLPDAGANDSFQYAGKHFVAGKRCMVRKVINPALAPLGKLDAYLSPEQRDQVIEVDPGDGTVTVTEKL